MVRTRCASKAGSSGSFAATDALSAIAPGKGDKPSSHSGAMGSGIAGERADGGEAAGSCVSLSVFR